MSRVLLVAPHFAPENVAGTYRSLYLARELEDHGFDVRVSTLPGADVEHSSPALSEVFPDRDRVLRVAAARSANDLYRAVRERLIPPQAAATSNGSAPLPQLAQHSPTPAQIRWYRRSLRRLIAEGMTFPDEMVGWIRPAIRATGRWMAPNPPDLIFASGPPFSGFVVARSLARRFGSRLVLDFRDPWGSGTGSDRRYDHPVWQSVSHRMERDAIEASRLTLFNSPGLQATAEDRLPQFSKRYRTILNGTEAARSQRRETIAPDRPLTFSHIGALYVGRHLRSLVEGLAEVGRAASGPLDLVVEQIGPECAPALVGTDLEPPNALEVRQVGVVSRAEALARADAPGVLVVVQAVSTRDQIPSKVFDYLATGNPILVIAPDNSAVWRLARRFERCRRLDLDHGRRNVEILRDLILRWQSGELERERTVEDTAHLSRDATGAEMIAALRSALEGG